MLFQKYHFLSVSFRSRDKFWEINTTGKSAGIPLHFVTPGLELPVNKCYNIPSWNIINTQCWFMWSAPNIKPNCCYRIEWIRIGCIEFELFRYFPICWFNFRKVSGYEPREWDYGKLNNELRSSMKWNWKCLWINNDLFYLQFNNCEVAIIFSTSIESFSSHP